MTVRPVTDTSPTARVHWLAALVRRLHSISLVRNSVYIMATTASSSLLGFFFWIAAARGYRPHDVGLSSALIVAMSLTSSVANLGLTSAIVQVLPKRESGVSWSRALNAALVTGTISALLAGCIVGVGLPLVAPQFSVLHRSPIYAWTFIISVPLMTVSTILDNAYVAERSAGKMLARNLMFSVIKLGLVVAFVLFGARPFGIYYAWTLGLVAGLLLSFAVLIPQLKRTYTMTLRGAVAEMRSMVGAMAGHYVINLGYMIPFYLLPVAVTVRLTPTANAYFYTTYMLAGAAFLISPSVSTSLFAEGSHAEDHVAEQVRTSFLVIGAMLLPAAIFLVVAGRYILGFFGPSYSVQGYPLLLILTVSTIPEGITNVYMSVLRVKRQLRYGSIYNTILAVLILLFAWVLLPRFGIVGVGLGWLAAQVLGTIAAGCHLLWTLSSRSRVLSPDD